MNDTSIICFPYLEFILRARADSRFISLLKCAPFVATEAFEAFNWPVKMEGVKGLFFRSNEPIERFETPVARQA